MYITIIVQLASPAIHNKDNSHIFLKGLAFFRVYLSPRIYVVYHVVVISLLV